MASLIFRFGVAGVSEVKRALASVASAYRKNSSDQAKTDSTASAKKWTTEEKNAVKGIASIGKIARQQDYKNHVARMRENKEEAADRIKEQEKAHKAELRRIAKEGTARKQMARSLAGNVVGAGSRALGTMGRVAGLTAGLVGGISVAGAVEQTIDKDTLSRSIANKAAPLQGETRDRATIQKDVLASADAEAKRTNSSSVSQLNMIDKFIERAGSFRGAEKLQKELNDLGDATGMSDEGKTQLSDVAGTMYSAFSAKGFSEDDAASYTKDALRNASKIGLEGQIGPEELAGGLGKRLISSAVSISGNKEDIGKNFGMLASLANTSMAIGGSATADEAGTAAMHFAADLYSHSKQLGKAGINLFDAKGNLNSPDTVIPALLKGTGGQAGALHKVLGERGIKFVQGFAADYRNLDPSKQAGYLTDLQKKISDNGGHTLSDEDVASGAKFGRAGDAKQIERAMNDFNNAVGKDLVPVVTHDLIPAFVKLAPYISEAATALAKYLKFLSDNPFTGLGLTFAALMTKELVGAGIGFAVKEALTSMLTGQALPAVLGGGSGAGLLGSSAKTLGAAGAAGIGIYAAEQSNEYLKTATGGMGIFDILGGMISQGTFDPAKVVDDHQNQQARETFQKDHPGVALPGQKLDASAVALTAAAKALQEAARRMGPPNSKPIGQR